MSDPAQLSMAYPGPSKRKDLKKKKPTYSTVILLFQLKLLAFDLIR